jgi:uncharacterized membrane protein YccC
MNWRRNFNRYVGLAATLVGMGLVFLSFVVAYEDQARIAVISGGFLILLVGLWYAANPFMTTTREFVDLREELDRFIGLARALNNAALDGGSEKFERAKDKMHASVDQMAQLAGKRSGAPARQPAGAIDQVGASSTT